MNKKAIILFPHQLFENIDFLPKEASVFLVEEVLFFNQYNFHKQKIAFHRASMKFYETYLIAEGFQLSYINAQSQLADVRNLIPHLEASNFDEIHCINPTDDWLEKRIKSSAK